MYNRLVRVQENTLYKVELAGTDYVIRVIEQRAATPGCIPCWTWHFASNKDTVSYFYERGSFHRLLRYVSKIEAELYEN